MNDFQCITALMMNLKNRENFCTSTVCHNEICVDQKFLSCKTSSECPGQLECSFGRCVKLCKISSDCPGADICRGGVCVEQCKEFNDCPGGKYCRFNTCSYLCQNSDDECPAVQGI